MLILAQNRCRVRRAKLDAEGHAGKQWNRDWGAALGDRRPSGRPSFRWSPRTDRSRVWNGTGGVASYCHLPASRSTSGIFLSVFHTEPLALLIHQVVSIEGNDFDAIFENNV